MMGEHSHNVFLPRGALLAAAALIGIALLMAGAGRLTGVGTVSLQPAEAQQSRLLRFNDRSDGAVVVVDALTQDVIDVLAPGTNGFIRSVMRGLARERMRSGVGAEVPFELIRGTDQRLTLSDPATGRLIALDAFGVTNVEAFGRLLTVQDGRS